MDESTLLRFKGYLNTRSLFKTSCLPDIGLTELNSEVQWKGDDFRCKNQRLGKLVEEFVFYQLQQKDAVKWLTENLQIQKNRQTIGELDALYMLDNQPIHLEVVYKFYLYDTLESYNEPLSYWIGPNRKDTLCYKLDKLRDKQFPLLFNNETIKQLAEYNIDVKAVSQQLCFKAQLFLPYHDSEVDFNLVNEDCVSGFYISFNAISTFEALEFFIPQKLDWLVTPYNDVNWQDYETAMARIQKDIEAQRSPLVWVKYNETKLIKCFITFW
ncbi:DUF1853 family protein [Winogradskyella psychrotolerans]|uniref:DUF1853 family protein n=1 Tax=Winogradskyella psychrotolerans TaxID=1344585 RepID=UPI001C0698CD|nr:DUF1853 family protein [Winogradskyella psychrotolerans]MBU2927192.1 DUF1853 family protein [Winogradskyella psychrotolerans]